MTEGDGGSDLEADLAARLAAAETALAEMTTDLDSLIGDDMLLATQAYQKAMTEPAKADAALKDIYTGFHNIKGIGGSFGFDLVTSVAMHMCEYLKRADSASDAVLETVAHHLHALQQIVDAELTGDGGPEGKAILARLQGRS